MTLEVILNSVVSSEIIYNYQIDSNKNSACKTQKLKQIRIHDFRHSCANYYINLGAQPILISKLLGHSNISIKLDAYSHLYPNKIEEIMILSDKFKKNSCLIRAYSTSK